MTLKKFKNHNWKYLMNFYNYLCFIFSFIEIKTKRLAQACLNDLVYVKYNRDLVDPILLREIVEINEWLMGLMRMI